MSAEPVFLDTNILVYANDTDSPKKRRSARELVSRVVRNGTGHLSAQVLSEFWVTVTREFFQPLDREIAQHQLALYSSLVVIPIDIGLVLEAVSLQGRHSLSYSDALVMAAALSAGCSTLFSEDMHEGLTVQGVTVRNPFAG